MAQSKAGRLSWWAVLKRDVWGDPTVGPLAAVLLTALATLIVWLTKEYAPEAGERAKTAFAVATDENEGVISVAAGYRTIAIMTVLTLAAGFEPIVMRWADAAWRRWGQPLYGQLATPVRWILIGVVGLLFAGPKLLSLAWSIVDTILARPLAVLAGAANRGWGWRYAHFVAIMLAVLAAGLFAGPNIGIPAILIGLIAVLAVVRRWTWIEADRNTFLVERGEREVGQSVLRIGFREDLRDEALFALACLFVLIPLGLDQLQSMTCNGVQEKCAFAFRSEIPMPDTSWERFPLWLGYFGAELAKTVPFVDWSEVFHVANGSPLKAEAALGSQAAFVLRAGLDLLFLAAVLQAVQIAGRLREQDRAFEADRLPILEPFAERVRLTRAGERVRPELDVRATAQPAIETFPRYEASRLKELVAGTAETQFLSESVARQVRRTAAALLQNQHEGEDTQKFWTERVAAEPDSDFRRWIEQVAGDLDPDDLARLSDGARRAQLQRLVRRGDGDPAVRTEAARALGRMGLAPEDSELLLARVSDPGEALPLRAAAAVSLAKTQLDEAHDTIAALAETVPDRDEPETVTAAMAMAYALAHGGAPAEEIAVRFAASLRPHAERAARLQRSPMDIAVARASDAAGETSNQMVRLAPGEGPFPRTFLMGSSDDSEAFPNEKPQREVAVSRAFAIGRFPVTQAEYLAFTRATSREPLQYSAHDRWPAIEVSWHDARAYCAWLSAVTGDAYRLPTEAEWEYACRAGTTTRYSWGEEWDNAKANSNQSGLNRPSNVGEYQPNDWGLWDMHGNVSEWCADPWHESYEGAPPKDEQPWLARGDFSRRVLRGGSWYERPQDLRSAARGGSRPSDRGPYIGFRVARTISPK